MKKTYSIVIPCYNEGDNIPLLLERFNKVIYSQNIEVILIDNGSSDGSFEVIKELIPKYRFAKTIRVEINKGYGYGILQGLGAAEGDYIGWTHADLQTDPKDVIEACKIAENYENVFIKGNRINRPPFDIFFTVGMSLFETILLGKKMWDINAQPTVFPKTFFKTWENPPADFALDLYVYNLAIDQKMKIIRFPVKFPPRQFGMSHWNTGLAAKLKFINRTLTFSIQLKRRGIK